LQVRPYADVTGGFRQFTRVQAQQTLHFALFDEPRTIWALWGDAGSYLNSKTVDLPAGKRFYAGGGGSVRGYRLYYAGPLNARGQPAGGRSLLGFGSEFRVKVTDSIGIVPFFEGANVASTPTPRLDQRLFYGAGLGFRYYTPIGPIRADLAIPLERRKGVDDAYQIYLSLGQAF
jgi:translocation and assembly module TamA